MRGLLGMSAAGPNAGATTLAATYLASHFGFPGTGAGAANADVATDNTIVSASAKANIFFIINSLLKSLFIIFFIFFATFFNLGFPFTNLIGMVSPNAVKRPFSSGVGLPLFSAVLFRP